MELHQFANVIVFTVCPVNDRVRVKGQYGYFRFACPSHCVNFYISLGARCESLSVSTALEKEIDKKVANLDSLA